MTFGSIKEHLENILIKKIDLKKLIFILPNEFKNNNLVLSSKNDSIYIVINVL